MIRVGVPVDKRNNRVKGLRLDIEYTGESCEV